MRHLPTVVAVLTMCSAEALAQTNGDQAPRPASSDHLHQPFRSPVQLVQRRLRAEGRAVHHHRRLGGPFRLIGLLERRAVREMVPAACGARRFLPGRARRRLSPRDVRVRVHDRYDPGSQPEPADVLDISVGLSQAPAHLARRGNRHRLQLVARAQTELQYRARVRGDAIAGEPGPVRLCPSGTERAAGQRRGCLLGSGSLKLKAERLKGRKAETLKG
jgi:hypothetical protein